jgi:alpha-tubulin suppressor-like RCC1 family protein
MVTVVVLNTVILKGEPCGFVVSWGASFTTHKATGYSTGLVSSAGQYLSNIVQVAAGAFHGVALNKGGMVYGWGFDPDGRASVPDGLENVISVTAGADFSLALTAQREVIQWGTKLMGQYEIPRQQSEVVGIFAGSSCAFGTTRTGSLIRWPSVEYGNTSHSNIHSVAVGFAAYPQPIVLKHNGTVTPLTMVGYGGGNSPPTGLSNVVSIAAGSGHYLALKLDGTVFGWGANYIGQATGIPTMTAENQERKSSGLVVLDGEVLTNVVSISASKNFSLALKADGGLVAWGSNESRRREIPGGLSNVVAIAAGETFCLAITTNAAVAERFRR